MTCCLTAPSHYMKKLWLVINCILTDKFQWALNRNTYIIIQGNALKSIVCEMTFCSGFLCEFTVHNEKNTVFFPSLTRCFYSTQCQGSCWCAILIAHQLLWKNMEAPVSIFQESPLDGEPRERLFHIHSVNRYQLRTKKLYPPKLLWQINGCNL